MKCDDCGRDGRPSEYLTQINPEGGYGRGRFLACDDCMRSGRWNDWIAEKWSDWPGERVNLVPDDDELMEPVDRRLRQIAVLAGIVTFVVVIVIAVAALGYYDAWELRLR